MEQRYRWKNKQIREQLAVISQQTQPTLVLQDVTYLHSKLRRFLTHNIWIHRDRIVYCGEQMPDEIEAHRVISLKGKVAVPGYIEPHVHPFQLYNPQSFSAYASKFGTTTVVYDNALLLLLSNKKKAFTFSEATTSCCGTMYWSNRFHAETLLALEDDPFTHETIKRWLETNTLVKAGKVPSWSQLLSCDDLLLHWVQEAKRLGKRVEGNIDGVPIPTLAKLAVAGIDSDCGATTGAEVYERLLAGFAVTICPSSTGEAISRILTELKQYELTNYDDIMLSSFGSSSVWYQNGVSSHLISLAIAHGVPVIDAYNMVTTNVARYFRMDHVHGEIAPGQIANINVLDRIENPTPCAVLAKGNWVIGMDGSDRTSEVASLDWAKSGAPPLHLTWDLTMDDLQFSMPFGIEMVDSQCTKPYSINLDPSTIELPSTCEESFLMLIDREGKWRINTLVKGFAKQLGGLCSSLTYSGDVLLVGKSKTDMMIAFQEMKKLSGGIVVVQNGVKRATIPLTVGGMMSSATLEEVIKQETVFLRALKEFGYRYDNPVQSLLSLCNKDIPYIRLTPQGIYDVVKKTILFPAIMR